MTDANVISLATQALVLAAKLAGPILLVSLLIGLAVAIFQSATQIQEASLSFVPKVAGIALVIVLAGHWMIGQITGFTDQLFAQVPRLLGAG
ncbi:MAG: flagellar biosynthesis protein FliQ [Acidimicrobiales bacterium]